MAIQGSGRILLSDLAGEFGDTKPYRISEFYRDGGKVPSVNTGVPASGFIKLGNFYNSVNELLQTVTAQASINAQTIFGGDWGTNIPKRLRIPAGTTIGPLTIPTGMGGTLEVDVEGEVQGLGGSANSGAGGHAITASASFTLNVLSGGAVRGGGGGGGLGGLGGAGQYTQAAGGWDCRDYSNGSYAIVSATSGYDPAQTWVTGAIYWLGFQGTNHWIDNGSEDYIRLGDYDYKRGGQGGEMIGANIGSGICRRTPAQTIGTSGGAGGNGGVGQGYGQGLSGGAAGAAGGTNAGQGGTGGSGGSWGSSGATGNTGASGNAGGGSAGSAGGAAGRAVQMNSGSVTVNNSGTINGAY